MSFFKKSKPPKEDTKASEDLDYYVEDGLVVMTAAYLLRRGYCCGNGCRHCPYGDKEKHSDKTE